MIKQALTLAALLAVVGFTPAIANDKDSAPESRFTSSNLGASAPATRSVVAPRIVGPGLFAPWARSPPLGSLRALRAPLRRQ